METKWNVIKWLSWLIIGIYYVYVASTYNHYISGYELNLESNILFLLVIITNIFLGLWVTRNYFNAVTFSFSVLLFSISWILFTFNNLLPDYLAIIQSFFISFFPVVFLNFFLYFIYDTPYRMNINRFYLIFLILIGIAEDLLTLRLFGVSLSIIIFFLSLILLVAFCLRIYFESRKDKILNWSSTEIKQLLSVTLISIAPFLFLGLIPSVINNTELVQNSWLISFVLIIPFYMGLLVSKHNLIIQHYWTVGFLTQFVFVLFLFSLLSVVTYVVLPITFTDLVILNHSYIIIGFMTILTIISFMKHRKSMVQNKIGLFQEERERLTYYQLKNKLLEQNLDLVAKYLEEKWLIDKVSLYRENNVDYPSSVTSQVISKSDDRLNITFSSFPYRIELFRVHNFTESEVHEIQREVTRWAELILEQEKLIDLKYKLDNPGYTYYEKQVHLSEIDLTDSFQNMVSEYLHDDLQQYIYYIKQMIYTENSIDALRDSIDEIIKEIELPIQLKTVEWMGYPSVDQEIAYSVPIRP